jgi:hypothetical protein
MQNKIAMTDLQLEIETLQNMLIAIATSNSSAGNNSEYQRFRTNFINNTEINNLIPDFLKTNRTTEQFWQFIKYKFGSYAERRNYIWTEFTKVLNFLESKQKGIVDNSTSETIEKFNQDYITSQWKKAIDRKSEDPEGAITVARTLIETTCKYILDEIKAEYDDDIDLPKLYKLTADKLNLAPDQHTEQIFKQILGGCQSVIVGLGALRNKLSDSHGKKVTQSKPSARHAELAVNLAGTMTTFLLDTYEFNNQKKSSTV